MNTAPSNTEPISALAKQVGGTHYTDMAIQPFEYSMANKLDPMQHTAIKYVTRFRQKGGIQDLRKAIHTIELLIEFEQRKTAPANDNGKRCPATVDGRCSALKCGECHRG